MSKKIGSLYYEITGDTKKLNSSLKESKAALSGMNKGAADALSSVTGLNLASIGAGAAIALVANEAKRAMTETVAYAASVRDLSKITGNSVEQTSRLIQVADDLTISQEELGTAMQAGVRKGIDVSVEGLAKLSDEYLKLQPGLERSKFLMDNFGRSGTSMAMMMEQGSKGIREMSAAIDDNLVMTGDAIQAARDYEIAMDNLGDAATGLQYTIGVPLMKGLTDAITAFMTLAKWGDNVKKAFAAQEIEAVKTSGSYKEYAKSVLDARIRTGEITEVQRDWILSDIEAGKWSDKLTDSFGLRSEAGYEVARSAEKMDKWDTIAAKSTRDLALSEDELKQKFSEVGSYISGDVTKIYEKFSEKNNELWGKANELTVKIGELESKSWLTDDQKKELDSLKNELGETKTAIEKNQEAYKRETNEFILNTALKYMALDGLSTKDLEVYTAMAENMGLIDKPTKDLVTGIGSIVKEIDTSKRSVDEFAKALSGIPDKDVTVRVHYVSVGGKTSGHEDDDNGLLGGYANGADFIVPPGYPNDSFPMRVQSGEHVQVTPAGQQSMDMRDVVRELRKLPAAFRDAMLLGEQ